MRYAADAHEASNAAHAHLRRATAEMSDLADRVCELMTAHTKSALTVDQVDGLLKEVMGRAEEVQHNLNRATLMAEEANNLLARVAYAAC